MTEEREGWLKVVMTSSILTTTSPGARLLSPDAADIASRRLTRWRHNSAVQSGSRRARNAWCNRHVRVRRGRRLFMNGLLSPHYLALFVKFETVLLSCFSFFPTGTQLALNHEQNVDCLN